jgi:hypothetical protein
LAYGVGSLIATGIVDSGERSGSTALFVTGAALMLLNSAFVIGIGVLMFPILRAHNKAIAAGYLGTRIFEGVGLAIGVVSLIVVTGSSAAIHANSVSYNVAEAGLGIGSLVFCALLFRTRLVARFLAVWGFIGYACFAGGTLLELFGVAGAGLVGAIPGGLFELTFGIWLIARGFASTATVRSRATDRPSGYQTSAPTVTGSLRQRVRGLVSLLVRTRPRRASHRDVQDLRGDLVQAAAHRRRASAVHWK